MNLDTTYSKLCQTLYKLSHWEQPEGYTPVDTSGDKRWPAYTTDYVLEKLNSRYLFIGDQANTPVNTLLKLAIRMFEDGVLVAEDKA